MTFYTMLNLLPEITATHSQIASTNSRHSPWLGKALFCQPKTTAACAKPRDRNPTKSSPQTASCGQPTVQGWLALLQAPWEHWHLLCGTLTAHRQGQGPPGVGISHSCRMPAPGHLQMPSPAAVCGFRPKGQRSSALLGACKSSTWSNSFMRYAWSDLTSFQPKTLWTSTAVN